MIHEEMQQTGVRIHVPTVLEPALVLGNSLRMQQVILNVLINARDAMPEGGDTHVALTNEGSQVVLSITDSGVGLTGVDSSRLFEPFWTSKEKGSGLGLAMSRRIVEDMNGRLTLNDRPDGPGALAEITLPVHGDGS